VVARRPTSPSPMFWLCSKVVYPDAVVNQRRRFAIFGTRAPADATRLAVLYPDTIRNFVHQPNRNQIFSGGQHRGACPSSPELRRTSQRRCRPPVCRRCTYIGRPRKFTLCLPFGQRSFKWPLVIINDAGWRGNVGSVECGLQYSGETFDRGFLSYFCDPVSGESV